VGLATLIYFAMEVINYERPQLPVKLEELAQFVLVGRDKLNMVRAGIKALDKLDVAEGVRQQKKEEAQMLAEALLDAEVRIGEILALMPKAQNNQYTKVPSDSGVTSQNTKEAAALELGFDRKQVSRFQTLAANKDLVEQIKQEAREADDLATRTAVLQAVKVRDIEGNLQRKVEGHTMPAEQVERLEALKEGQTIVLNMNKDHHLLKFAQDQNLYVRCDRFSEWGNPFWLPSDGTRDEVCDHYEFNYLPFKPSLLSKVATLKGKALGCHCYPERCHCETLKRMADEA
jgi:hypothetical protein